MCFGVYICIFKLCFMFIAANIVGCRLRHQDVRCTPRYCTASHFFLQIFMYWEGEGGAPTVRFAPVVPWAKTSPVKVLLALITTEQSLSICKDTRA
jgi:hypothetical protein